MSAREIDMLHGTLWNKIIVFAIPLVLTAIFEQLFNAADTLILGRYDSAAAMAAVGNNTPLVGLIIYLFLGLSLGANVLIAQAIGAGRLRDASRTVHAAILLALFTGLAVAALCLAFAVIIALLNGIFALLTMHAIFSYFTSDPEVIRFAETRIEYVVAFSFLCAIGDTLSAALRGYGNSIGPAVIAFFAICGSRLAWVFLVFPSYRTFANLLLCYPLSWILAAVLLGIYYRTFMRHLRG
ncbi:MATE family efflux transporter [Selenomonas bovis]|uniref:MATE family efflux transporter n=1 Tax=Selenomonas bovis TaxID=416586 RepID=UPI003D036252